MPFNSLVCFPSQADEISHVIAELEKSIARYKEEYAGLISQAQAIKADLAAVEAKVRLIICLGLYSQGKTLSIKKLGPWMPDNLITSERKIFSRTVWADSEMR